MPVTVFNVFLILVGYFNFWDKKNIEYIIEMQDAVYVLRHSIYDVAYGYKVQMICNALLRPEILCDSKNMVSVK